jgi:hypothetical protein
MALAMRRANRKDLARLRCGSTGARRTIQGERAPAPTVTRS